MCYCRRTITGDLSLECWHHRNQINKNISFTLWGPFGRNGFLTACRQLDTAVDQTVFSFFVPRSWHFPPSSAVVCQGHSCVRVRVSGTEVPGEGGTQRRNQRGAQSVAREGPNSDQRVTDWSTFPQRNVDSMSYVSLTELIQHSYFNMLLSAHAISTYWAMTCYATAYTKIPIIFPLSIIKDSEMIMILKCYNHYAHSK